MKKYTIGALFTPDFRRVLLIQKSRPEWQKGKLNLPGGHIEDDEDGPLCVAREFEEEAGVWILPEEWPGNTQKKQVCVCGSTNLTAVKAVIKDDTYEYSDRAGNMRKSVPHETFSELTNLKST